MNFTYEGTNRRSTSRGGYTRGNRDNFKGNRKGREKREWVRKNGSDADLIEHFHDIDGKNYPTYKSTIGDYDYEMYKIHIDKVQSDPYAPPSLLRVSANPQEIGIPADLLDSPEKRVAVADFLARTFSAYAKETDDISMARPGQEILERSYATVMENYVELRFQLQFQARGRMIMGHRMAKIVDEDLPDIIEATLNFTGDGGVEGHLDNLRKHVETYEDYLALQETLTQRGWIGFIADGSILPRRSGVSDEALSDALAFTSPENLRQTVDLPYAGTVSGMPVLPGITLIVGGGYHGKSTLLSALERSVYGHIPGDGRELVALEPNAVKVRAADGRSIKGVDVSLFINALPTGTPTDNFSTENASGSTSQAASVAEALELGTTTLLIDEDTSATNLMIRDERMRALVAGDKEPITPYVDRIKAMAESGISTVMVMGGSGDYLDCADHVLMMDHYRCVDVTQQAHEVAQKMPRNRGDISGYTAPQERYPLPLKRHGGKAKTRARGVDEIFLDRHTIDVSDVEQIVDSGQTEAIAWALRSLTDPVRATCFRGETSIREGLSALGETMNRHGLDALGAGQKPHFLVRPRLIDIAAALNRYRTLKVEHTPRDIVHPEFEGTSSQTEGSAPTAFSPDTASTTDSADYRDYDEESENDS